MSWTPANSFGTRAAHPSRIRVLSEHRESTYPSQVVTCRPHFAPISPLAATLMDLPASVAGKRLTAWLSPLDATLTRNWGRGQSGTFFHITAHLTPPPIFRTLFPVAHPASPLLAALTRTPGVWGSIPTRQVLLGTFQPSTSIPISLPRYFHSSSSEPPIPA